MCNSIGQWVLVWQCFARDPQMDLATELSRVEASFLRVQISELAEIYKNKIK